MPRLRLVAALGCAAVLLAAVLAAVAHEERPGESTRFFRIVSPGRDEKISGNVILVRAKPRAGLEAELGRFDVLLDVPPPPPGQPSPGTAVSLGNRQVGRIYGVRPGPHTVRVYEVDFARRRIGPVLARSVTVNGPSIDAVAPVEVREGAPAEVRLEASGLPADFAGRVSLVVDENRPPRTKPITDRPTVIRATSATVTLPPLARGFHRIWVVYTDARHIPHQPPVLDLIRIAVR
jgi:hypothetical protein